MQTVRNYLFTGTWVILLWSPRLG